MNNWFDMSIRDQAELIFDCFPTLTNDQRSSIVERWSSGEYESDWHGSQQAIADLLGLCRWESMSETQQDQEHQRLTDQIGDW